MKPRFLNIPPGGQKLEFDTFLSNLFDSGGTNSLIIPNKWRKQLIQNNITIVTNEEIIERSEPPTMKNLRLMGRSNWNFYKTWNWTALWPGDYGGGILIDKNFTRFTGSKDTMVSNLRISAPVQVISYMQKDILQHGRWAEECDWIHVLSPWMSAAQDNLPIPASQHWSSYFIHLSLAPKVAHPKYWVMHGTGWTGWTAEIRRTTLWKPATAGTVIINGWT